MNGRQEILLWPLGGGVMPSSKAAAGSSKHSQDLNRLKAHQKKLDHQIKATFELHRQRQKQLHDEHRKLDQQLAQHTKELQRKADSLGRGVANVATAAAAKRPPPAKRLTDTAVKR
jgi:septal ring factor EnvC (AmiA/AmiB activator)